jgi:hypothetical protein
MNKNVKKYNYFKKLVAMPLQRCALGTGYHVIEKYLHSEIYLIFLLERHFLENNRKQDYTSFNAKQLRGILLLIHSTNKFIKYSLSPVWSTDDTNMNLTISLTSRNLGITKEKADMSRKLVTLTLEAKIGAGACL